MALLDMPEEMAERYLNERVFRWGEETLARDPTMPHD